MLAKRCRSRALFYIFISASETAKKESHGRQTTAAQARARWLGVLAPSPSRAHLIISALLGFYSSFAAYAAAHGVWLLLRFVRELVGPRAALSICPMTGVVSAPTAARRCTAAAPGWCGAALPASIALTAARRVLWLVLDAD
jgi:hypothetical protein